MRTGVLYHVTSSALLWNPGVITYKHLTEPQVNPDGFRCSDKSRKRDQKQSSLYTEIGTVCELFSYISKDIAATTATTALTTITAVI